MIISSYQWVAPLMSSHLRMGARIVSVPIRDPQKGEDHTLYDHINIRSYERMITDMPDHICFRSYNLLIHMHIFI